MWTPQLWYDQARAEAAANASHVRGMAALALRHLCLQLPQLTREEVVERLQKSNAQRLEAVPSLQQYPELRGMQALIAASWQGARDGAELDDALLAAHCDGQFYYHRHVASGNAMTGCTAVFFPHSDYGPLLSKNLDSTPDEPVQPPISPVLSEHLLLSTVSSGVFMDEVSPEIFPVPVKKLVARYCRSTAEAVEMLQRYNEFWGPCNALIADRDNNVAMIEKTACRIAVRLSEDGFGFVTAMAQEDPEMRRFVAERRAASLSARKLTAPCSDTEYWAEQDKRHQLLKELLEAGRKNPTLQTMREIMHFRDPARGQTVYCGEPIRCKGKDVGHFEHTLLTSITQLRQGHAQWWTYDKEQRTPVWENPQPTIEYPEVLLW